MTFRFNITKSDSDEELSVNEELTDIYPKDYDQLEPKGENIVVTSKHRTNLPFHPLYPCVAIYNGPVGTTKLRYQHLLASCPYKFNTKSNELTAPALISIWLDILFADLQSVQVALPTMFRIDMALYISLVQWTGLCPFLLKETQNHGSNPPWEKFASKSIRSRIGSDVVDSPFYHALLYEFTKWEIATEARNSCFVNSVSNEFKPHCQLCSQHHMDQRLLGVYPSSIVVKWYYESDIILFCPYYEGVDYNSFFQNLLINTNLTNLTFADLFESSGRVPKSDWTFCNFPSFGMIESPSPMAEDLSVRGRKRTWSLEERAHSKAKRTKLVHLVVTKPKEDQEGEAMEVNYADNENAITTSSNTNLFSFGICSNNGETLE
jgi:hypothetical protein